MLPMLTAPRPLTLWRMRESLEDLWLMLDALVEPGGVRMTPLPRQVAGGPDDRLEAEERLLCEVRQGLTVLLQAIDEELLCTEEHINRESWNDLPWPERQRRLEAREALGRLRRLLMKDFTKSLTGFNHS